MECKIVFKIPKSIDQSTQLLIIFECHFEITWEPKVAPKPPLIPDHVEFDNVAKRYYYVFRDIAFSPGKTMFCTD